jgi:TRAP-type transport system periplasmic protein
MTTKLTWVIAHEPYHLFLRAADEFSKEIHEETNGRYELEVMGLSEWNELNNENLTAEPKDREKVVDYVNNGKIDIASTYVETLGKLHKDLWVLGLPFLFNDHDHADRTLDGSIGLHLLDKMGENSNIKGLAFTYSGGYRIIPSSRALETLEDFYDLRIACSKNPVSYDMFTATKSLPIPMLVDEINDAFRAGIIEAGSTTYARFFEAGHHETAQYINDTQHSLFLTSIIANQNLWNSMGKTTQEIFARAALRAAKIERDESILDNFRVQQKAASIGIETIKMTSKENNKFKLALKSVYPKYESYFGSGLVGGIQKS